MPVTFSYFSNTDPFNPQSPASYERVESIPPCSGTLEVCSIYAQVDANDKPIITTTLSNEIATALNQHASTTNVKLRGTALI